MSKILELKSQDDVSFKKIWSYLLKYEYISWDVQWQNIKLG